MTTTAISLTSPNIMICDVELVAGLWSHLPSSQSIRLEFINSHFDNSSNTISLYSVRISMGHKPLRSWMLTLDLSVTFNQLIAQDNRVTTEVYGIFNQASSARFWNTAPGSHPETNDYHFTIRVTSTKIMPAEITSAYFCGEY